MTVAFDPSRQSPFVQESLLRLPFVKAAPLAGYGSRQIDAAIIRLSKTLAIGTTEEQEATEARERMAGEIIRQHLRDALERLVSFWSGLQGRFQQERLKGGFPPGDLRASEWQTWAVQWLDELKGYGEETRLHEAVAPVTPHFTAQNALRNAHTELVAMPDFYFEVLTNARSLIDPDLQRAEQAIQSSLGNAIAELGQPADSLLPPIKIDTTKPTVKPIVIVTAPLVNVRNGPGMNHGSIKQLKKDDVLDFIGEHGEWFQVQLGGAQTGWVHRNVASKRQQGEGSADDIKRLDMKPSSLGKRAALRLEPINLSSTPVEFIPRPTSDEVRIYTELEHQLRDVQAGNPEERRAMEQRKLQHMSDNYGLTPEQIWNTYLTVQGWEIRP
jgi:uncharacterized protein YgiM (DUF1202 family)